MTIFVHRSTRVSEKQCFKLMSAVNLIHGNMQDSCMRSMTNVAFDTLSCVCVFLNFSSTTVSNKWKDGIAVLYV